jgi:hypothetical protein
MMNQLNDYQYRVVNRRQYLADLKAMQDSSHE